MHALAPSPAPPTAGNRGMSRIITLRMSPADFEEARALAAEEDRKVSAFFRAMYRRGLADFKAKRAALSNSGA